MSQEVRLYAIGSSTPLITISSNPTAGPPYFKLTELRGWHTSSFSGKFNESLYGVGGTGPKATHRGMKQMAIEGVVWGGTNAASVNAMLTLAALFKEGSPLRMEVADMDGLNYWMNVYANDSMQVEPFRNNGARFLIPVIAPDPRKYSTTTQQLSMAVSGPNGGNQITAAFTNAGTAPAHLRAMLAGGTIPSTRYPMSFGIAAGSTVIWGGTSGTFQSVEFLPDHGGVAVDPNNYGPADGTMTLQQNEWPYVLPGSTQTVQLSYSGASTVSSGTTFTLRMWSCWW